jgi:predicted ATPase/transcriptional regulator with XRE-family HTH domain
MAHSAGFGELLRRYRTAAGLTQEQLAEGAGLSVRGLSDLERGLHASPHPDTVSRLARALGLNQVDRDGLLSARRRLPATASPLIDRAALPVPLTSFVGRQQEMHDLRAVVSQTRLLTLTGVSGVGKTRAAVELARVVLDDYPDGVRFVDLAPIVESGHIGSAIAQSTGVLEHSGRPLVETLASALASRHMLLVLDNCEHLVAAASTVADCLLQSCPHLRIIATSREPLGADGEVVWRLHSLAEADAVRLFQERARAAESNFAVTERNAGDVAEVCRRLDGLPLAIELAAARTPVLSPGELAARLNDRFGVLVSGKRTAPPRHQTLRAGIDWSYGLLDEQERRLFARLSVFAGSFSLSAAEAVCGEEVDVLESLANLVDRSLVGVERAPDETNSRYRLLETLHAYASERLHMGTEAPQLQQRHARWALHLAEQAERSFHGPDEGDGLGRLAQEHDNLRAALAWATSSGDAETALRLVAALGWYYGLLGAWTESREWVERALRTPSASAPTLARARALTWASRLAVFQGHLAVAQLWLDEAVELGEQLGDEVVVVAARSIEVQMLFFAGAFEAAAQLADDLLPKMQRLADRWSESCWCQGRLLATQANTALGRGNFAQARGLLESAADLARASGDAWSLAMNLSLLGDVERASGANERAGELYAESLALHQGRGMAGTATPSLLHNLGYVELANSDPQRAAERFGEAIVEFRRLGDQRGIAESVVGLGAVAAFEGRADTAARLFGSAEVALESLGTQLWPSNRGVYERSVAAARAALEPELFDDAWSVGRQLSLDQAAAAASDGRRPAR